MAMLSVSGSDAIKEIGYRPRRMVLRIRFNHDGESSKRYKFCGVPPEIFNGLLYSQSKGAYYDKHIRGKFMCFTE